MNNIYAFERYNNFLSKEDSDFVYNECQFKTHYIYGERDHPSLPPTGMVKRIEPGNAIYDLIINKINKKFISTLTHSVRQTQTYINFFHPKEHAYFHKDGHCLTYLYYPGDSSYDDDQDGYTIFDYGNITYAEKPIPNTLVRFYGNIRHKASPFRTENRYSVVTKYLFND